MSKDDLVITIWVIFGLVGWIGFIGFCLGLAAYLKTKEWEKKRREQAESDPLVESHTEDDFIDTEDELDYLEQKAEEDAELGMTFWQKFRAIARRMLNGTHSRRMVKKHEREQRQKMAKAVARESARLQQRRYQGQDAEGFSATGSQYVELPSYVAATEFSTKN